MTESIETNVLMKCKRCGYEEEVPEWVLDELAFGRRGETYEMACPECDRVMVEKSFFEKNKLTIKKRNRKKK